MRAACSICLCNVLASGSDDSHPSSGHTGTLSAAECGHVFHDTCLQPWLQISRSCPTCRKQLRTDRVVRLFLDTGDDEQPRDDEVQALRLQLAEADRKLDAVTEELRVIAQHAQRRAQVYRDMYTSTLRDNFRLRVDMRAMMEDMDLRQLRRENSALQAALNAKEREIHNYINHVEAGLKDELRRRESQIRAQALHTRQLEQELQRHQAMLHRSGIKLNAQDQMRLTSSLAAEDTSPERETRSYINHVEVDLMDELRRRESQIRAQALHVQHLEQELQRHQVMLRCSRRQTELSGRDESGRSLAAADTLPESTVNTPAQGPVTRISYASSYSICLCSVLQLSAATTVTPVAVTAAQ